MPDAAPFDERQVRIGRAVTRAMSKANIVIFQKTAGRFGSTWHMLNDRPVWKGPPVCLLTSIGRKSGQERIAPLLYLLDGDDVIVVASQGGMPKNPPWYLNVGADPKVQIQIGKIVKSYVARTADEAEKARLWPMLVEMYPDFVTYQARAGDRVIPVVICSPS